MWCDVRQLSRGADLVLAVPESFLEENTAELKDSRIQRRVGCRWLGSLHVPTTCATCLRQRADGSPPTDRQSQRVSGWTMSSEALVDLFRGASDDAVEATLPWVLLALCHGQDPDALTPEAANLIAELSAKAGVEPTSTPEEAEELLTQYAKRVPPHARLLAVVEDQPRVCLLTWTQLHHKQT